MTPPHVARSRTAATLGEIVRQSVKLFAYPNGKPGDDYTATHVGMVRNWDCLPRFLPPAGGARGGFAPRAAAVHAVGRTGARWGWRLARNLTRAWPRRPDGRCQGGDSAGEHAGVGARSCSVLLVGPLPPPSGGMANQTRQLARLLEDEGCRLGRAGQRTVSSGVGRPGSRRASGVSVRAVRVASVAGRAARDLIHVMANSGWAWHLCAVPAIWIGRLRRKPVVVNYRGGEAELFLLRQAELDPPDAPTGVGRCRSFRISRGHFFTLRYRKRDRAQYRRSRALHARRMPYGAATSYLSPAISKTFMTCLPHCGPSRGCARSFLVRVSPSPAQDRCEAILSASLRRLISRKM